MRDRDAPAGGRPDAHVDATLDDLRADADNDARDENNHGRSPGRGLGGGSTVPKVSDDATGLAGTTKPPRRHLRRRRRQLRRLLAGRDAGRGLPLRPRRPDARDRPLRSARDHRPRLARLRAGPGSRARSTACACTGPTRPSAGTAATRASCSSIPTPRRCGARSTGRSRCSATSTGERRARGPDDRPARQRRRRAQGRGRRRPLRLGRRPAARDALAQDDHLRGPRARLHQAPPRACPEPLRGTYAGLAHPAAIEHLQEARASPRSSCCPVHEFADDGFLEDASLRNYWGYSTLGYFAPEQRYAGGRHARARRSPSSRRW